MSKIEDIIISGRAPGFPQGNAPDPDAATAKVPKAFREVENEPIYKHGPARGARRIEKLLGMPASHINEVWRRPMPEK